MSLLKEIFFGSPKFTLGGMYDFGYRGMSPNEIMQWQLQQAIAQQNAWANIGRLGEANYLAGLAQYQPHQRPLDERFADFKIRLAAACAKHGLDKGREITPNQPGS